MNRRIRKLLSAGICAAAVAIAGCAGDGHSFHQPRGEHPAMAESHAGFAPPGGDVESRSTGKSPAIPLENLSDLDRILPDLARNRVVFVGETHDQYAHHLVQLEIIRHLHETDRRVAIGMEFFQQPFQDVLDKYVAGEISEREMLRATEYYKRWSFDYRLYAPILRYAREHKLPLVALNASKELVARVSEAGLEGVSEEDSKLLPSEIDRSDTDHENRIRRILSRHPHGSDSVEEFLEVQLLWDESMAERAADWLGVHPDHRMVVLAGSGHLAYGGGIPDRLQRRITVDSAIVLNDWQGEFGPGLADYLLMPDQRTLPPSGKIGVMLEPGEKGLEVVSCVEGSACEEVGLQEGDRLLSINGTEVVEMADLRVLLWDMEPGNSVTLTIERERLFAMSEVQSHQVRLR